MALALYRKYRPRTFAEVIGQEHVTEPLSQALRSGRLHHAYLFSGPRGCGKTSSARILARSLNCEQGPTPEPCGVCASCRSLTNDGAGSIDVIEIDAASHGGVDDARDLREKAFFAPASSRYKIYVIDEAHMVSPAGFNALLKLVEEPPDYVKFIFATTEPEKVLGTIRSRTHHYPFRLIPPAVLRPYLQQLTEAEGVHVDPAVLPLVVRAGGGSARDTLSVLDQLIAGAGPEGVGYTRAVELLGVTDAALLDEMCDAIAAGDGAAAYQTIDRVAEAGHDARRFASDLLERFRDLIILQQIPDAVTKGLIDGPADQLDQMGAQATRLGPATLSRCADIVHNGLVEMRGTTAPRLLLELITARMLLPGADDSSGALLQRLERMERRLTLGADEVRTQHDSPQVAPPAGASAAPAASSGGGGGISAARAAAAAAGRRAPASGPTGQAGPAEAGPAQTGPAQSGPAQGGVAQGGAAQASATQDGPAQVAVAAAGGVGAADSAIVASAPGAGPGSVDPVSAMPGPVHAEGGEAASVAPVSAMPGSATPVSALPSGSVAPVSAAPSAAAAGPVSAVPGSAQVSGAPAQQDPRRAPAARSPEPAGIMPDAPVEPVDAGFAAPGRLSVASIREVWPEIMVAVGRKSKKIAALAQGATVRDLDGQTVVLTFRFPAHAKMVAAEPALLSDALYEALGGRWQIRCDVAGEGGASAVSGPAPRAPQGGPAGPAPRAPQDQGSPDDLSGRGAPPQASDGVGAATRGREPAPRAAAAGRDAPQQPSAASDDSDEWPEPARPGGPATAAVGPSAAAAADEDEEWPEPARLGGAPETDREAAPAGPGYADPSVGQSDPAGAPDLDGPAGGRGFDGSESPGGAYPGSPGAGERGGSGPTGVAGGGPATAGLGVAGGSPANAGPGVAGGGLAAPGSGASGGGPAAAGRGAPGLGAAAGDPVTARNGAPASAVASAPPASAGRPASSGLAAARAAAAGAGRGNAAANKNGGNAAAAGRNSAWSDGSPTEEAPYDPEYDGPVRPGGAGPGHGGSQGPGGGAAFEGFDPGDEPLDDVIDEKTARQSSEQQAVQLLRDALGAEKISES
ncbi:DNA polymerase III subunit gamma and tau [Actinoplanes sp. NPDC026623]|uniref:DNA polymerase III subunit gamma and tau n=1 Tax=Actinoplanes sp. NPDC026623 TaxID=3155610 RepID=UPI0033F70B90